jgi:hypothetical protein
VPAEAGIAVVAADISAISIRFVIAARQKPPDISTTLGQAASCGSSRPASQLRLYRGDRSPTAGRGAVGFLAGQDEEAIGTMAVKELRNLKAPEWNLVCEFYRLWNGEMARPTPREVALARDVIACHGPVKAKRLMPLAVKTLKDHWPDAKTFGAVAKYLPHVSAEYDRRKRIAEREKQEHLRAQQEQDREQQERATQERLLARWRPLW